MLEECLCSSEGQVHWRESRSDNLSNTDQAIKAHYRDCVFVNSEGSATQQTKLACIVILKSKITLTKNTQTRQAYQS